jgi:hypothetical protein
VIDTRLCEKVCQLFVAGWWFCAVTLVSITNEKIVQPYHGENSIHFDEIIPAFYKHDAIDFFIVFNY